MGGLSIWHWLLVGVVVMLFFGKGRFSDMMGDVAKGIKSFKKGMSEDDDAPAARPASAPRLQQQSPIEPNQDRELQPMKDDRPHN
ncbi:twin-arginine translocase TatA/TatE family subunit [Sphingomonas oleivorans]|uniref:Sec-independent protein translocase protein TatA n=1 Tax=Sphingomonas oleivorans TaxID=1735121 RepID=A0A2T5FY84_9SPHN|nr:twin-arginine translocase TatA/TatE family subunit [Sphingomonas oleivorans]PTQ11488.1 twin-arginine translocase TatA/TatE family subunit [Sphingomonas oleivorans]